MSATFEWCLDKTRLKIFDRYLFRVSQYGTKSWYLNGLLHRENGPAVEYDNGDKEWYLNDQLHRENGPALEFANGIKSWRLNGKYYNESDYWKELQK